MACTLQDVLSACASCVYPRRREDIPLKAPLRAFHGRALRRLPAGLLGVHRFVWQRTDTRSGSPPGYRHAFTHRADLYGRSGGSLASWLQTEGADARRTKSSNQR